MKSKLRAAETQEGGAHYKKMSVEPWSVVADWPLEQQIGFFRGGALKYIMRMGGKDRPVLELKKARHYLDALIEILGDYD